MRRLMVVLVMSVCVVASTPVGAGGAQPQTRRAKETPQVEVLKIEEALNLEITQRGNSAQAQEYLTETLGDASFQQPSETMILLNITLHAGPKGQEYTASATGTLKTPSQEFVLRDFLGDFTRVSLDSGEVFFGDLQGQVNKETHLTVTITYKPSTQKAWTVVAVGDLTTGVGILGFGERLPEAFDMLPKVIHHNQSTAGFTGDTANHSSGCDDVWDSVSPTPYPEGDDPKGRRWQSWYSSGSDCNHLLGQSMLWAPDNVRRGQSLQYGFRIWSNTSGAARWMAAMTNGYEVRDVAVRRAIGLISMPDDFSNAGHTSPRVGLSGSSYTVPIAKLYPPAEWVLPNVTVYLRYTEAELYSNGGFNNEFQVTWYNWFGFSPSSTNASHADVPYEDLKGFGMMSPFAWQRSLPSGLDAVYFPAVRARLTYIGTSIVWGGISLSTTGPTYDWMMIAEGG